MSDSKGLDPAAASAASPAGGGGGDSTEAANLQREIRRLKRELIVRSAGRTPLRGALERADDEGTPKSVKTRTPLGKTPSASERRTATKLRGTKPMSEAVAKAVLKNGIPELDKQCEYIGWTPKFLNYARAINVTMYALMVCAIAFVDDKPEHIAANDELHTLLITACKGSWATQCLGGITDGDGLAAWAKLKLYRVRSTGAAINRKYQAFIGNTRQGPDQTVEDFAGEVTRKADDLIAIGRPISDEEQMQTFVSGLLPKFATLQDNVSLKETTPSYGAVLMQALALEETIKDTARTSKPHASDRTGAHANEKF